MSLVAMLLTAEAAARNAAVRRTAFRHRRVAAKPLVVATYNLAGEAAAPLAFCYGTEPRAGKLVVIAEPRNRAVRFAGINAFSADLVAFIAPYLAMEQRLAGRVGRQYPLAREAPQIVVPNLATRDYLGARLGRSLRYLGLGQTHSVPEATHWAGAHLSWLAEHLRMPGQSIFVAATELLARHFATGQSALEDENLATLLAWIDNEPGSGLTRILEMERKAGSYGPTPDPELDRKLEPHVLNFGKSVRAADAAGAERHRRQVERLLRPQLTAAYRATHRALRVLRDIPEAPGVQRRWDQDVRAWTVYARRCAQGLPRFKRRHDALQAAQLLETWSRAAGELAIEEAYDDLLVMAEHDAQGRCLSGLVTAIDVAHRGVKEGHQRATLVPLLRILTSVEPQLLEGDEVYWAADRGVRCVIQSIQERGNQREVELAVLQGHKGGTRLPPLGAEARFAALSSFAGQSPDSPREVPWTHAAAPDEATSDAQDEPGLDLSPEETVVSAAARPPEDEVPGVLV